MVSRLIGYLVLIFGLSFPVQGQNISPWSETVVSVRDIQASSELFLKLGQWRVVSEGNMAEAEARYWKLAEGSAGQYRLICAPNASTGCIRFVRIDGAAERMPIRAALRPWDTGGIFSTMVRSDNAEQLYEDALKMGWWAERPPIRFQFGKSDLRNVVLRGPDGVNLAVYERIAPSSAVSVRLSIPCEWFETKIQREIFIEINWDLASCLTPITILPILHFPTLVFR